MNPTITKISVGFPRTLALLFLLAFSPLASALADGDISVTYLSLGNTESIHGYMDHRFIISNRPLGRTHQVEVRLGTDAGQYLQLSRTVTVGPGASATVMLYQPAMPMLGNEIQIIVDGARSKVDVGMPRPSHGSAYFNSQQLHSCALVSKAFGSSFIDNGGVAGIFARSGMGMMSGPASTSYETLATVCDLPMESWPSEWLAYSRFDVIFIDTADWSRLPANVRDALTRYVEMGGNLIIKGDRATLPDAWIQAFKKTDAIWISLGFGTLSSVNWPGPSHTLDPASKLWRQMSRQWTGNKLALANKRNAKDANDQFPVIEKIAIPARSLLILVILFSLIVGPLNMFLLARKGRKIWLYWTVPTISVLASLLVFGFTYFAEGIRGEARTGGITLLDQSNQHASTLAWTAYYFPLQPWNGLSFSRDAELTLQAQPNNPFEASLGKSIVWTDTQHYKTGWIASRVPSHFAYRKSETRRERVVINDDGAGHVTVQNSLGETIRSIFVRTSSGAILKANNVLAGATASTVPFDSTPEIPGAYRRLFMQGTWFTSYVDQIPATLMEVVPTNGYLAILEGNPFVEDASSNLKRHRKTSVVIGINGPVARPAEPEPPPTPAPKAKPKVAPPNDDD